MKTQTCMCRPYYFEHGDAWSILEQGKKLQHILLDRVTKFKSLCLEQGQGHWVGLPRGRMPLQHSWEHVTRILCTPASLSAALHFSSRLFVRFDYRAELRYLYVDVCHLLSPKTIRFKEAVCELVSSNVVLGLSPRKDERREERNGVEFSCMRVHARVLL